ncbi:MAG: sigma-70 family RNA polymerase sigma factor [Deltaproteobacteria bacterium]|jgi:RNA polymerase sigma-70 factor (ECF subfamily)
MAGGEVTELLAAARGGDREAADALMPVVYDELHRRAAALMQRESRENTLQATALVHEAYLVLVRQDRASFNDRAHFFAVAAQMMRRILVDHARSRSRDKRGAGVVRVQLDEGVALSPQRDHDVIALDDALRELAELDPRQAEIVAMRFFGGLTVAEVAEALNVSKRAVESEWTMAKAWLRRALLEQ